MPPDPRWRQRGFGSSDPVQVSPRAVRDTPSPHSGGVGESIPHAFPSFRDAAVFANRRVDTLAATRWRTPC